jgi:hypothetical protein
VRWNSVAGQVSGTIIAIHITDFEYKGHVHHASEGDPQYEIKSDRTDHVAAHKGGAVDRLGPAMPGVVDAYSMRGCACAPDSRRGKR